MGFPLCIATGNKGKQAEFAEMLSPLHYTVTSLRDHFDPMPVIAETGATFLENAFLKAEWVHKHLGISVIADDSGLQVDALDGAPGVYSARYAGEGATDSDNILKLLSELDTVSIEKRSARFTCVLACILDDGRKLYAEGVCEGTIGLECKGTNGFGYDPLFIPRGHGASFGELESSIKNALSHRGSALASLVSKLNKSGHATTIAP